VVSAGLDRVHGWSAERRSEFFEQVDPVGDTSAVGFGEVEKPVLEFDGA
jgi:hypothetical protein